MLFLLDITGAFLYFFFRILVFPLVVFLYALFFILVLLRVLHRLFNLLRAIKLKPLNSVTRAFRLRPHLSKS